MRFELGIKRDLAIRTSVLLFGTDYFIPDIVYFSPIVEMRKLSSIVSFIHDRKEVYNAGDQLIGPEQYPYCVPITIQTNISSSCSSFEKES